MIEIGIFYLGSLIVFNIHKDMKKENKEGLKPCPFCARHPKTYEFTLSESNSLWTVCCSCGAESPRDSVSKNGARRIWNRRRYPPLQD